MTNASEIHDAGKVESSTVNTENSSGDICVLDMGKHKKKRVKQLRRGKGKLLRRVENAIDDLKEEGIVPATAQMVVVVVREDVGLSKIF